MNDLERLARTVQIKERNGEDYTIEYAEMKRQLFESAKTSESTADFLGLNEEANAELKNYIGDAGNFPYLDLEKTIEYLKKKADEIESITKENVFDKKKFFYQAARASTAQWHFNYVSKPLTKEYLNTIYSTYLQLSPYTNEIDREDLEIEVESLQDIIADAKNVVKNKDLKGIYKTNADLHIVMCNIMTIRSLLTRKPDLEI